MRPCLQLLLSTPRTLSTPSSPSLWCAHCAHPAAAPFLTSSHLSPLFYQCTKPAILYALLLSGRLFENIMLQEYSFLGCSAFDKAWIWAQAN